jgi:endonuclease VIII
VPEGDSLHRAARRLQVLVGEVVEVETPHPRAQAERIAERLDGRRLEAVEAVGKNLVMRFDGGLALRSHLRMSGRWTVRPRGEDRAGRPWLIVRGARAEGVLWNGPVLRIVRSSTMDLWLRGLGPDILARPPDLDGMLRRMRGADATRTSGETFLDQRIVAGIGNMWMAEALWTVGLSPWRRLGDVPESERRRALEAVAALMRASVDDERESTRRVYRRAGRPCRRCGTTVRSWGQGDANRTTYWCPTCQVGDAPREA